MPEYFYHFGIGGVVFGCVASVFAASWLNHLSPPRCIAAVCLLFLGTRAFWIGLTAYSVHTSPRGDWWVIALFGWTYPGPFCLGIFLVTLLVRVLVRFVWRLAISPTETSREDRVLHDQVARTTSVPESVDGDPYQRPATSD